MVSRYWLFPHMQIASQWSHQHISNPMATTSSFSYYALPFCSILQPLMGAQAPTHILRRKLDNKIDMKNQARKFRGTTKMKGIKWKSTARSFWRYSSFCFISKLVAVIKSDIVSFSNETKDSWVDTPRKKGAMLNQSWQDEAVGGEDQYTFVHWENQTSCYIEADSDGAHHRRLQILFSCKHSSPCLARHIWFMPGQTNGAKEMSGETRGA